MARKYNKQTGAAKSRAAMIGRHEGEAARTDAGAARERMIERGQKAGERPQSAQEARDRMIARHDDIDDAQRELYDTMNTATARATKKMIEGEDAEEGLIAACLRDIYGEGIEAAQPEKPQRSAEEARREMIDRMSGANPDRLPGNGR